MMAKTKLIRNLLIYFLIHTLSTNFNFETCLIRENSASLHQCNFNPSHFRLKTSADLHIQAKKLCCFVFVFDPITVFAMFVSHCNVPFYESNKFDKVNTAFAFVDIKRYFCFFITPFIDSMELL